MHMKDDHMRNAQLKPGYNVQIGVDSENILSEKGILYRMNRSIQVEGAFGVLKNDYEFQRFLLRGKTKVKLEILLLCMGYNWKESTVQKILSDFFTDDRARASLYHLI